MSWWAFQAGFVGLDFIVSLEAKPKSDDNNEVQTFTSYKECFIYYNFSLFTSAPWSFTLDLELGLYMTQVQAEQS